MAFVDNNLVLSRDVRVVKSLIDRLKKAAPEQGALARHAGRPSRAGPGAPASRLRCAHQRPRLGCEPLAGGLGRPRRAEVALPENFTGVGFRFGFASEDIIKGDGYFYFGDEEAAQGGSRQIEAAIQRLCAHFHLKPRVVLEQQGSRPCTSSWKPAGSGRHRPAPDEGF